MMKRRERNLAIAAGVVLGLLVLDQYVLSPMWRAREAQMTLRDKLTLEWEQGQRLMAQSRQADRLVRLMRSEGGLGTEVSATESRLIEAMQSWAQESRLQLVSIRPERATVNQGLRELSFAAAGEGNLRSMMLFLHRLESAKLAVRVRELQISARTEGSDDLSISLRISSIWEEEHAEIGNGVDGALASHDAVRGAMP